MRLSAMGSTTSDGMEENISVDLKGDLSSLNATIALVNGAQLRLRESLSKMGVEKVKAEIKEFGGGCSPRTRQIASMIDRTNKRISQNEHKLGELRDLRGKVLLRMGLGK